MFVDDMERSVQSTCVALLTWLAFAGHTVVSKPAMTYLSHAAGNPVLRRQEKGIGGVFAPITKLFQSLGNNGKDTI